MAHAAVDAFGGIDILVNNAAIMTDLPPYGLRNMPVDEWDRVMNVNLRGPLLCTQAVVPAMDSAGGGRIVNGLSAGAFMPGGIYGVSKYALHGLTVNLASELGGRNINVNAIAPGLVDNESGYASLPKDSPFRDALAASDPGQDVGTARGPRRDPPAALLASRRLDHRADDPHRRRLDHAPVSPTVAGHPDHVLAEPTGIGLGIVNNLPAGTSRHHRSHVTGKSGSPGSSKSGPLLGDCRSRRPGYFVVTTDEPATTWRELAVARSLDSARNRAETRVQRFLDAALELMHDNERVKEFTVHQVAERSGQSLRSFYQHFGGKHELLFALFEESVRSSASTASSWSTTDYAGPPGAVKASSRRRRR